MKEKKMTADDYRAIGTQCELFDVGSSLWFLREIAVQLSELNAKISLIEALR